MIIPELVPIKGGLICVAHNDEDGTIKIFEKLMTWKEFRALKRAIGRGPIVVKAE